MMRYRLFGFTIESDVEFRQLAVDSRRDPWLRLVEEPDLRVPRDVRWLQHIAWHGGEAEPWLSIGRSPGEYVLEFHDQVRLRYRPRTLAWTCLGACSRDSLQHVIVDQALPLIAAHEGHTVLHAALATRDGRAALVAGAAGSGKSTLVAGLARCGWSVASDDAALVTIEDGSGQVQPSYGGLRLWPDSSEALDYRGGHTVSEGSDKRRFAAMALPGGPLRLEAVHVLRPASPGCAPQVRDLSRRDAVMALVRNAYVLDVEDRAGARAQLDLLSSLAARVSVREVIFPHRYDALDAVRALIEAPFRAEVSG